jgi:hypothetical protein
VPLGDTYLHTKLSEAQVLVLRTVHARAYAQSARYRELVEALRADEERRHWIESWAAKPSKSEQEQWAWQRLIGRENSYHCLEGGYHPPSGFKDSLDALHVDPYRACLADWFHRRGVRAVPMQEFVVLPPKPGWDAGRFRAAFRAGDLFIHVNREPEDEHRFHERDRQRHIVQFALNAGHHRFVFAGRDFVARDGQVALTPDADLRLQQWIGLQNHAELTDGPTLRIKLPGDIRRRHLFELLYQEGMFIESLGLEVSEVSTARAKGDVLTSRMLDLLGVFWTFLAEVLSERGLVRFHDVLSFVRDHDQVRNLGERFESLRHLFVDEFQDISPELVHWLQVVLTVNAESGEVSFTGIGDDYQSIYGWRGSNPSFIIDFAQHFSSPEFAKVSMDDNFRCRQEIIDAAESVVAVVRYKTRKHGRSAVRIPAGAYPVRLADNRASWIDEAQTRSMTVGLAMFMVEVLRPLEASGTLTQQLDAGGMLSLLILARTNDGLRGVPRDTLGKNLAAALRAQGVTSVRQLSVRALTYHSAKGLEAHFVLMLEDSLPPDEHPLRNLAFQRSGLPGTYSENQRDESRRLGYVALTRARFGLVWVPFIRSRSGAEQGDPLQANDAGCYVAVRRHLEQVAPAAIRRPRSQSPAVIAQTRSQR